jgi:hypothetical protein
LSSRVAGRWRRAPALSRAFEEIKETAANCFVGWE